MVDIGWVVPILIGIGAVVIIGVLEWIRETRRKK